MEALSDAALQAKTGEFRTRLDNGEDLDDLLIEAFAVVREAGKRVLGQRHYDVQLVGGAALHFGWIAEMKTGEGKTLVSTLPAYLNGLGGKGTHLITVNEYLARRDAEWMGRLHRWLGLEVGLIVPGRERPRPQAPAVRRRHHLRHQQRVRLRLPPRQHGDVAGAPDAARAQLRHRRRGRLDPHRRGPHAADHLGPRRRRRAALLQVRHHRPRPPARRGLRRRRGRSAPCRPPRAASRRSSRPSASTTSTTASPRTSCTSSRPRCAPRSCSSATRTTSSTTAR